MENRTRDRSVKRRLKKELQFHHLMRLCLSLAAFRFFFVYPDIHILTYFFLRLILPNIPSISISSAATLFPTPKQVEEEDEEEACLEQTTFIPLKGRRVIPRLLHPSRYIACVFFLAPVLLYSTLLRVFGTMLDTADAYSSSMSSAYATVHNGCEHRAYNISSSPSCLVILFLFLLDALLRGGRGMAVSRVGRATTYCLEASLPWIQQIIILSLAVLTTQDMLFRVHLRGDKGRLRKQERENGANERVLACLRPLVKRNHHYYC
jgi:hypothetical protein